MFNKISTLVQHSDLWFGG